MRLRNGWRQKREQVLTGGGWIRKAAKRRLGGAKRGVIGRNHSFPGGRQAVQDATKMPLLSGKDQIGSHEKLVFALCV